VKTQIILTAESLQTLMSTNWIFTSMTFKNLKHAKLQTLKILFVKFWENIK